MTHPDLCRPDATSKDCSLDRLTAALAVQLAPERRDASGAEVAALLREYAVAEESWRGYAQFRKDTYSRNLIWRSDDFELLLLCWGEGQVSPIHDHSGQHCWMAVLEGELQEVHFEEGPGGLREGRIKDFPTGGVAYIHDDIALHLIRPKPGTHGVSLHLYSSPIDACRTFCPDTGAPTAVQVGYHSVRGSLCGGEDPARIRQGWKA
ncbi:MAG: cysteine dioxygenase family protein [Planctomycetota bacterium]